jgi:hypothetical protein
MRAPGFPLRKPFAEAPRRTGLQRPRGYADPCIGDEDMVCPQRRVYRTKRYEDFGAPEVFRAAQSDGIGSLLSPSGLIADLSRGTRWSRGSRPRQQIVSTAARGCHHPLFSPHSRQACAGQLPCGDPRRSTIACLTHGSASRGLHSPHPLQKAPLMLPPLASASARADLAGFGGFARAMRQRVAHGQQNAHRCLSSGRNPGGGAPR